MSNFEYINDLQATHNLFFCNTELQMFQMLQQDENVASEIRKLKLDPDNLSKIANHIEYIVSNYTQAGFCRSVAEMSLIMLLYIVYQLNDKLDLLCILESQFRGCGKLKVATKFISFLSQKYREEKSCEYTVNSFNTRNGIADKNQDISGVQQMVFSIAPKQSAEQTIFGIESSTVKDIDIGCKGPPLKFEVLVANN